MYRRHGDKLALVFLACDLLCPAGVWLAAYFMRFTLWPSPRGIPELAYVLRSLPGVLLLAAIAYRVCGLYEVHRLKQLPRELGVVCKASGMLFLLAVVVIFYRRDLYESRLALTLFLVLNALTLMLVRRLIWRALKYLRGRGLNYGRAVIVGNGRTARAVARAIRNNSWTGLEAVGFVDRPGRVESNLLPRLGEIGDMEKVVTQHDVDHVFVALPISRYGELPELYRMLSDLLVDVQLVPDLPNVAGMRLRMVDIDDLSFLGLRQNPHYGWPKIAKRAMDLVLGTLAVLVLSPLLLALAIAVRLTSPGPVLYRQSRAGLRGRTFQMLKFRSMRVGAEQGTGPVWASRNDQRCTPLGRFMRRWSLDELPQLWNVLAGDMSLVGPRPERGVFIEKFRKQIPGYAQRHQVKTGMTGWAQVHGWRGDSSLRHRIQCDLYYIANWSLFLDLQILLMTLWRGPRHRNAH
jgi:exopolysaccharide biosynthesis polyprenyl glycosylphosphotransferase